MSDLTDEELAHEWSIEEQRDEAWPERRMIIEIRRHRAARAADEERVRSVVRGAVRDALLVTEWRTLNRVGVTNIDDVDPLADAIATRAAKQLASAAVRLSDVDRALIDAGLGVLTSDYNDVPHDKIAELRERLATVRP